MRTDYKYEPLIDYYPKTHSFRTVKQYDMSWVKDLPNFVGFMETSPTDGDYTVVNVNIDAPYEAGIRKLLYHLPSFAPYSAQLCKIIDPQTLEPIEFLHFRVGLTNESISRIS
jgi:hypothetical protein